MAKIKGTVEVGKPIYKTKSDRLKAIREDDARRIKYYCKSVYPGCANCDYAGAVNDRITYCRVNSPINWDVN